MKRIVYQVAVGRVPDYYKYCIESVKQYCAHHGLEHVVQREPLLKIKPINSQRIRFGKSMMKLDYLPIFEKENSFNYLKEYDQVCVIDADVFARDNTPNIFDDVRDDVAVAAVRESDQPLTERYLNKIRGFSRAQYEKFPDIMKHDNTRCGIPFYNSGVVVWNQLILEFLQGDTPEQFVRRKEFEGFVNGEGHWKWAGDQTMLNYWIYTNEIPSQALPWQWNALFKAIPDSHLPQSNFLHFFMSDNLPKGGSEIPSIIKDLDNASRIKEH